MDNTKYTKEEEKEAYRLGYERGKIGGEIIAKSLGFDKWTEEEIKQYWEDLMEYRKKKAEENGGVHIIHSWG